MKILTKLEQYTILGGATQPANPDLTWEETIHSISISLYRRNTPLFMIDRLD